jgi:predicted nucleic acid-binding protein
MDVIVVDNSALLPLFLSDEADDYAQLLFDRKAAGATLIAPSLCLLEFGNGILKAVRRNRLKEAEAAFAHRKFATFPLEFRDSSGASSIPATHALAQRRQLSFYDATYLALALNEGARLASLDAGLRNAAVAEGVVLV